MRQIRLPESPWDNLTDEEIVLLAQAGNSDAEEYLLQKYENGLYMDTLFFLQGGEMDDVFQEGMTDCTKPSEIFCRHFIFWALQNYVLQEM